MPWSEVGPPPSRQSYSWWKASRWAGLRAARSAPSSNIVALSEWMGTVNSGRSAKRRVPACRVPAWASETTRRRGDGGGSGAPGRVSTAA
ncbi:MAG: hypothetical protein WDW36_008334 [Sanguina aurantia]